MKIRWLNGALRSIRAIHARIAAENPAAARRVVQAIGIATRRLAEFPASGRRGRVAGTYEVVVSNLPYVVIYRVTAEDVQILRVFHTAMNRPLGGEDAQ